MHKITSRQQKDLIITLRNSLDVVSPQVIKLCEYLQELRVGKEYETDYARALVKKNINKITKNIPIIPVWKVITFGTTQNNLDQFEWFETQIRRHSPNQSLANLSLPPWSDLKRAVLLEDNTIQSIAALIIKVIEERGETDYHRQFIFNYALNFVKYYIAFCLIQERNCPLVCVSNDHTAINMGFAKAAKAKGFFVTYVQHAFVTRLFPPLDFDLSILFNKKSAELYGAEHEIGGNVLIIPRKPNQVAKEEKPIYVDEIRNDLKNIVIYLGGSNDIESIRKTIKLLGENKSIINVTVKLHPNPINHNVASALIKEYGATIVCYERVTYPHIAICGNSSVVMNLLAMGVRCYHLFDLDSRQRDYYGFVSSKAAIEIVFADLATSFWVKWESDGYIKNRSIYVPDAESEESETHIIRLDVILRARLKKLPKLFYFSSPKEKDTELNELNSDHQLKLNFEERNYLNSILLAKPTSKAFNDTIQHYEINALKRIKLIEQCYSFRHPIAIDLMIAASKYDTSYLVRTYSKYRVAVLVGSKVDDSFEEEIASILGKGQILSEGILILNQILIYLSTVSKINLTIALRLLEYHKFNFNKISSKVREKVFRVLSPTDKDELPKIDIDFISTTVANKTHNDCDRGMAYSSIVESYLSDMSEPYRQYLRTIFIHINDWIQRNGITDLRLARYEPKDVDIFWQKVEHALVTRTGFSLIRAGDGEGYIFASSIFSRADCLNRERHWWGVELHEAHRSRLQVQLKSAMTNADVIGVPTVFRFQRDMPSSVINNDGMLKSIQRRGLIEVLNGIQAFDIQIYAVVEDRANDYLFKELIARVRSLSKIIENVVLVSSLPAHAIASLSKDIDGLVSIGVPTRSRTFNHPGRYLDDGKILPYVYKDVMKQVAVNAGPGVLLLVAAGVIGKLLLDVGKKSGAVALDIGEVAEQWVV